MFFSLRVAIADDHSTMRETVQQMLRDLGHDVVAVAENGESLVNQCASTQPDVVITSTLTPAMHGSDAAAVIYERRPIPIILYSRRCEPDLVLYAEHKHVFMYLVKPIYQEHLQAALKKCYAMEPNGPAEDDENTVLIGVVAESFGSVHYREHSRPPYRRLSR